MQRIDESSLGQILSADQQLRQIEPQIYSLACPADTDNAFDEMAWFYDRVICNRFYNRIMWGYSTADYAPFTSKALNSSKDGWVLDAGCGSLAFNAKLYADYSDRPVVLLDNSLKLLKIAKSRLAKLHRGMPQNIILLQGDALQLPFKERSFETILSLNLLHVFEDVKKPLLEFKRVLANKGSMSFTTLISNNRFADGYLATLLKKTCNVAPRTEDQLRAGFAELEISFQCRVEGNMAFIN